jgi:hypothetical protein
MTVKVIPISQHYRDKWEAIFKERRKAKEMVDKIPSPRKKKGK